MSIRDTDLEKVEDILSVETEVCEMLQHLNPLACGELEERFVGQGVGLSQLHLHSLLEDVLKVQAVVVGTGGEGKHQSLLNTNVTPSSIQPQVATNNLDKTKKCRKFYFSNLRYNVWMSILSYHIHNQSFELYSFLCLYVVTSCGDCD